MDKDLLTQLRDDAEMLVKELLDIADLRPGSTLVVGCSTSELRGKRIGKDSSLEAAAYLYEGIAAALEGRQVRLAAQCCEHLNRALIVERSTGEAHDLNIVNAVPSPQAGGSWASVCYQRFSDPVAVEAVRAQAALDIGDTLIGMHLRPVVVPVRLSRDHLLEAHLTAARVRPPYSGGPRAEFDAELF